VNKPLAIIENKVTKERFEYLETSKMSDGKYFKFRVTVAKGAFFPVYHVHPNQDERFKLESGKLRLRVAGKFKEVNPGEEILISRETAHQWWNIAAGESVFVVEVTPAGNMDEYIKQLAYLCNQGKCNAIGLPSLPQVIVMMNKYETYKAGFPPVRVQKLTATILTPIIKLFGFKDYYPDAES
jgi:quercetin dioxygenase-like cupin family protein